MHGGSQITIVPAVILVGLGMQPKFMQVMAITLIYLVLPMPRHRDRVVQLSLAFSLLFRSVIPHGLIGLSSLYGGGSHII